MNHRWGRNPNNGSTITSRGLPDTPQPVVCGHRPDLSGCGAAKPGRPSIPVRRRAHDAARFPPARRRTPCHSRELTSATRRASGQHASGEIEGYPGRGLFHRGSGRTRLERTMSRNSHSGAERHPATTSAIARRARAIPARGAASISVSRSETLHRRRWTTSHISALTSRTAMIRCGAARSLWRPSEALWSRTASTAARAGGAIGTMPRHAVEATSSRWDHQREAIVFALSVHQTIRSGIRVVRCTCTEEVEPGRCRWGTRTSMPARAGTYRSPVRRQAATPVITEPTPP